MVQVSWCFLLEPPTPAQHLDSPSDDPIGNQAWYIYHKTPRSVQYAKLL